MHIVVDVRGEAKFHLCNNDPDDLVYIPPDTGDWRQISNQFLDTWKHPNKPRPQIQHIFYVAHHTPEALAHLSRFSNYSNKVGNTQLLFHGTPRRCRLGFEGGNANGSAKLCRRSDCILCLVLRGSYDIEKARTGGMFGYGIYSTTVSSKADGYASKRGTKDLKSIILNHVVLGRTTVLKNADHNLRHAPGVYNSVTAATRAQGGGVDYHEAIVYREDAMCACAVIFYK